MVGLVGASRGRSARAFKAGSTAPRRMQIWECLGQVQQGRLSLLAAARLTASASARPKASGFQAVNLLERQFVAHAQTDNARFQRWLFGLSSSLRRPPGTAPARRKALRRSRPAHAKAFRGLRRAAAGEPLQTCVPLHGGQFPARTSVKSQIRNSTQRRIASSRRFWGGCGSVMRARDRTLPRALVPQRFPVEL
jgi:hypothetical protein